MISIADLSIPAEIKNALTTMSQDITIHRSASKGSNGHLFFGINHQLGREVAIKFYYWGGDAALHLEPKQLATVKCTNIVEIYHAGKAGDEWAYFTTPYCRNGDMDDLITRNHLSTHAAIDHALQILTGLVTLHSYNFIHRDLKPQNILLNDENLALIGDFGSVRKITSGQDSVTASGHALIYRPPESIASNAYTKLGDIYQVGIVLYQLLGGELPYDPLYWLSENEKAEFNAITDYADGQVYCDNIIKQHILKGRVIDTSSLPMHVSNKLRRVINRACNAKDTKRFESASFFHTELTKIKRSILDWHMQNSVLLTKVGKQEYRIVASQNGTAFVEKKSSTWRKALKGFPEASVGTQISRLEKLCNK